MVFIHGGTSCATAFAATLPAASVPATDALCVRKRRRFASAGTARVLSDATTSCDVCFLPMFAPLVDGPRLHPRYVAAKRLYCCGTCSTEDSVGLACGSGRK